MKVTDSEVLNIPKVSRLHMGAYLCIASNDVPPSVSKRIILKVQCEYRTSLPPMPYIFTYSALPLYFYCSTSLPQVPYFLTSSALPP